MTTLYNSALLNRFSSCYTVPERLFMHIILSLELKEIMVCQRAITTLGNT